jgi:hypothetical protein
MFRLFDDLCHPDESAEFITLALARTVQRYRRLVMTSFMRTSMWHMVRLGFFKPFRMNEGIIVVRSMTCYNTVTEAGARETDGRGFSSLFSVFPSFDTIKHVVHVGAIY